jgi:transcriptional regulator with XRE-family HTH domain
MPTPSSRSASALVEIIRLLLAQRGLSLADVARMSRSGAPYGPLHHVPHNLYDVIRRRQFSPSLYQIATLSLLSGYRFGDWLRLFGFSLGDVLRFQIFFPALRTVELDGEIYYPGDRIPMFQDLAPGVFDAPLTPLGQWLSSARIRSADAVSRAAKPSFRFVKIGSRDAFAFPDLLPGSIVRVNASFKRHAKFPNGKTAGENLFLVEHGGGYVCSRIFRPAGNRILLCSKHLPYSSAELELGTQVALVGTADMEFRRTAKSENPVVPRSLGGYWKPLFLPPGLPAGNVGEFIRRARRRSGLSFREASKRTRVIARVLRDARYFCAPGSLSDYETWKTPPRHVHKLISICAVYYASAAECLEAAGVSLASAGELPMPPHFLGDTEPDSKAGIAASRSLFVTELARRFHKLPYFLFGVMPSFFGMPDLSIRDIFWSGGVERFIHPYLKGAVFLVVDRKKKIPRSSLACPKWAQPLYVFLRRDGSYLCGSCVRTNGILAIQPFTAGLPKLLRLRNRTDAEVVGQVVGIVRRLP